jgi:hypothetical protein
LHEVGDLVARVERDEALELDDGLVELALAEERLPDQEPGARRVARVRMALDDLAEAVAGVLEALALEVRLALGVQLVRRQDRDRRRTEKGAAAGCEKSAGENEICDGTTCALPEMLRVRQTFPRPRVPDIPRSVADTLSAAGTTIKRGDVVGVGAGSRGIANIDVIVGATVRWLRDLGAKPFVFPAMGSHGGGTADGQLDVLAHYGITEQTMGCPVRATMDVVQVGEALGLPVWLDRFAAEADWIGIVNRVKPHTDFKGQIESGLFKMMTIGLGKYQGAVQYHRANVTHSYERVITSVGQEMLRRARIGFGLAILENGYDETAHLEAFAAPELEAGERRLLKQARDWMMKLPFPNVDVLIVEEMGKNVSGSGMDTNVIGRPTNPHEPFPSDQKILWIVVLDLNDQSYGNATGIGNADFTTRRLVDKIDMKPTLINCITACSPGMAKVPATLETDREAIESALSCIGLTPPEKARVIRVRNTLKLGEVEVSAAYFDEVRRRSDLSAVGDPRPLSFDAAGTLIPLA